MRNLPTIVLAAAVFLLAVSGEAADQATPEPKQTTAPTPSMAIPQAEVAARATEVSEILRTLTTILAPSSAIETIQHSLPEVSAQIDREFTEILSALKEQPTLETHFPHPSCSSRVERLVGWPQ